MRVSSDAPRRATVRIGIFRDAAFQFYYPENLEAVMRAGARIVEISPLHDTALPNVDALYVGGGFPETLAQALADNEVFRAAVRRAVDDGLPVYAECGGAVYLGETLEFGGRIYPMVGALPAAFAFKSKPQGHGYAVLEATASNPFFSVGALVRGHEFHYTYVRALSENTLTYAFRVRRGHGIDGEHDGLCTRNVVAAYTHVHSLGTPTWGPALVAAARRHRAATRRTSRVAG
jgi:cobyrinic acid a,c-diamide synthase